MLDDKNHVVETYDPFNCLCFVYVMLSCLFIAALWSPVEKGLTSWHVFLCFCHF